MNGWNWTGLLPKASYNGPVTKCIQWLMKRADKISKMSCECTVNHSLLMLSEQKDFSSNDTNFTKNKYRRSVCHSKLLDIFYLKLTWNSTWYSWVFWNHLCKRWFTVFRMVHNELKFVIQKLKKDTRRWWHLKPIIV